MNIIGTDSHQYKNWRIRRSATSSRNNGAYWYAKEIEDIILPEVEFKGFINTVGAPVVQPHQIPNGSVIVVHNNTPATYRKFLNRGMLFICPVQSIADKFEGEKTAVIPLSIDTEYVKQFKTRKTKGTAYAGNKWGYKLKMLSELPDDVDQLYNMERDDLLREMAKYKNIIAEGRCLLEAKALGCKTTVGKFETVKTSDRKLLDSREAIPLWAEVLKKHEAESINIWKPRRRYQ